MTSGGMVPGLVCTKETLILRTKCEENATAALFIYKTIATITDYGV